MALDLVKFPDTIDRVRAALIGNAVATAKQIKPDLPATKPAGPFITIPVVNSRRIGLTLADAITVIDCWHDTEPQAADLAHDVAAVLDAWARSNDPAAPWGYQETSLLERNPDPDTGAPRASLTCVLTWTPTA